MVGRKGGGGALFELAGEGCGGFTEIICKFYYSSLLYVTEVQVKFFLITFKSIVSNWNSINKKKKGRKEQRQGEPVSLRMQTTVLPLSELCWGGESEGWVIAALVEPAWADEPSSANWWHHGGRESVWKREEGEAPLWVYKFMLYPWPNTKPCHPCSCLLIHPSLYPPRHLISFSLGAQNHFIKWSTVLTARPRAKQCIDPKSLFK